MKSLQKYILLLSLLATRANALTQGGETLQNPLGTTTFEGVVQKIITGLLQIATPIVAIMVIVGGFMIMTAGGNSEKVKKGRDVVLYAVIGFAVILFAQAVVSILKSVLGE